MEIQSRKQLQQAWAWRKEDEKSIFSDLKEQKSLLEALGFADVTAIPRIISFVGGGGKTTSMYHLAEELAEQGLRVLVTTTTHIQYPNDGQTADIIHVSELDEITWEGKILTAGKSVLSVLDNGRQMKKLTMPEGLGDEAVMARLLELADVILIEADGAKCKPLKVPRDGEPVLIPQTGLVIACAGLSSIGCTFEEVCFRFAEYGAWLRRSAEEPVEPEDLSLILMDERGSRKGLDGRYYRIILNQADGSEYLEMARRVICAFPVTLQPGCAVTFYQ